MAGLVTLTVIGGPLNGKSFIFDRHDTLVFGRGPDCHARLPEDDETVSRNHFLLEVNPPDARLRDLGSTNGTFVNDAKFGGKNRPGRTEKRTGSAEVDLKSDDIIRAGATVFRLVVETPAFCSQCATLIPEESKSSCFWAEGSYVCRSCRGTLSR